ncbi:hypothetical protein [Geotalea sp. SG265]|uniref:hypothetical protein n=1 Tax=Geotalea sp. SG265 TaxID=2922867 RepID=UPI001FAFC997|nr:hypothetical protein [Geotalea sp. SG265]
MELRTVLIITIWVLIGVVLEVLCYGISAVATPAAAVFSAVLGLLVIRYLDSKHDESIPASNVTEIVNFEDPNDWYEVIKED